jgi:hypothetical protein
MEKNYCPACGTEIVNPGIIDEAFFDTRGVAWHLDCHDGYVAGD